MSKGQVIALEEIKNLIRLLLVICSVYEHVSLPHMYMQALLGPATVGLQIPLLQVQSEVMAERLIMANNNFYRY